MTVISVSRQSTEDHPTKKLSENNTFQPPQKNQVLYDNEGTPKIEIPEGSLLFSCITACEKGNQICSWPNMCTAVGTPVS